MKNIKLFALLVCASALFVVGCSSTCCEKKASCSAPQAVCAKGHACCVAANTDCAHCAKCSPK